ncbi:MAG: hypothetical protein HY720_18950 [Planctomycetes bacterium]|nr:hypothetical protein [Planctomycetota bacterium]
MDRAKESASREEGFASGSRREHLWAIAERIVPPAARLDESARIEFLRIVDRAVAERPAAVQRQLGLFLVLVDVLAVLRRFRTFRRLPPGARDGILAWLDRAPIPLLRKGFWGLKTLLLMGYYARPACHEELGYRPLLRGGGLAAAREQGR